MKSQWSKPTVLQSHAVSGGGGVVANGQTKAANLTVDLSPVAPGQTVELAALLDGHDRLYIAHGGRKYCLRITAQNKLILTA